MTKDSQENRGLQANPSIQDRFCMLSIIMAYSVGLVSLQLCAANCNHLVMGLWNRYSTNYVCSCQNGWHHTGECKDCANNMRFYSMMECFARLFSDQYGMWLSDQIISSLSDI